MEIKYVHFLEFFFRAQVLLEHQLCLASLEVNLLHDVLFAISNFCSCVSFFCYQASSTHCEMLHNAQVLKYKSHVEISQLFKHPLPPKVASLSTYVSEYIHTWTGGECKCEHHGSEPTATGRH